MSQEEECEVTCDRRICSLTIQAWLSRLLEYYSYFLHIRTTMTDNEPKKQVWITNPLAKHNKRPSTTDKRRLSRWFVNNQKSEAWGKKALNSLHIQIVVLLAIVYACHVIGSPYIRFVQDHTALTVIYVLETLLLVISILRFVKMCLVNGSWTATKLLLDKTSVETYIFAFWLIRSFVIEILKGQVIYSFVLSFHSILIFATDTWYMCDRKVLLFSMVLYLVLVVYEFFVSISPVGPSKPSWKFMNIETTYFPAHLIQLDQVGESHGLKGIVFAVTKIKFYIIAIFYTFIGFHFSFDLQFLVFFNR